MKPVNIILVRHGQSEGNVDKTVYSRKPDYTLNLTLAGIQQAVDIGKEIAKICNDWTAFYVSPFFRTRQTAECIQQSFKHNIWKSYEDVRLREQEWGGHISQGFNEDHETQRDEHGTFYWRFPNGESCADVFDRVSDFMNTLYRDFEKPDFPNNTVIVTHGMAMRVFLMRWLHLTVEQFELLANPSNCGIYHLRLGVHNKYELVTPAKMHDTPYNKHKYKPATELLYEKENISHS